MAIRMKAVTEMNMSGTAKTHARTDISVRDVSAIIDEPEARGGTNMGLTPTETQLSALVGCTTVITHRLAKQSGVTIEDMEIKANAQFDRRGASLEEEIELPFPSVTLEISLATDASEAQLDTIKSDLGRYCPIAKLMRGAGTEIAETWSARPL